MARKLGSKCYDSSVFSGKGVELLYKILNENKPVSPTHAESIRTLIKAAGGLISQEYKILILIIDKFLVMKVVARLN